MNSITARNKSEKRFKMYGKVAVTVAISFLVILLYNIFSSGISAFKQTYVAVQLDIPANLDKKTLNPRSELNKSFLKMFPDLQSRAEKRAALSLLSKGARYEFKDLLLNNEGKDLNGYYWFLASSDLDMYIKGTVKRQGDTAGRIDEYQMKLIDILQSKNLVELHSNKYLFSSADSREPEMAGIKGAILGSLYAIIIAFLVSFPIAVMSAVYLEKIATKKRGEELYLKTHHIFFVQKIQKLLLVAKFYRILFLHMSLQLLIIYGLRGQFYLENLIVMSLLWAHPTKLVFLETQ